jgi:hypothetical protein
MSGEALFRSANHWLSDKRATSEKGNLKSERMSVSDPGAKIEWGADREPQKNERVPSSAFECLFFFPQQKKGKSKDIPVQSSFQM